MVWLYVQTPHVSFPDGGWQGRALETPCPATPLNVSLVVLTVTFSAYLSSLSPTWTEHPPRYLMAVPSR